MSTLIRLTLAAVLAASPALMAPAQAQQNDAELLKRAQLQLRQSEQERNSLRAEVQRLQAQLQQNTAELNGLRGSAESSGRQAAALQSTLSSAISKNQLAVKTLRENEEELSMLRAQNGQQQRAVDNMRTMLENAQRNTALKEELVQLCRSRNQELYGIGKQVVDLYAGRSAADAVMAREPLLQMHRVKMENLVQDYEDRLRSQQFHEDTLPPSIEKQMQEQLQARKAAEAEAAPAETPADAQP
jgi:hypothetical protein